MKAHTQNSWKIALPLIILLIINIVIGFLIFRHYGDSYDEEGLRFLGDQSLNAYKGWFSHDYSINWGNDDNIRYYGPSYLMFASLIINPLQHIFTGILVGDLWHLVNFLTFQIAIVSFYYLCMRWLSNWSALGATLLFSTQPLIWGHAFINPKDIPFMTFFLASILTGLWMCDRFNPEVKRTLSKSDLSLKTSIKHWLLGVTLKWQALQQKPKTRILVLTAVFLISWLLFSTGMSLINKLVSSLVEAAYTSDPKSMIGQIFSLAATHANTISVEQYITKAQTIIKWTKNVYLCIITLSAFWSFRWVLPWSIELPTRRKFLSFLKEFFRSLAKPRIIFAGIILGFTSSIRVLGPLAGLIVIVYLIWKFPKTAIPSIFAYGLVAILFMLLTWPFLWTDPIKNFIDSLTIMSNYPWLGEVLFFGNYFPPANLPAFYLPIMFSIQFTEPTIILMVAGFIASIFGFFKDKKLGVLSISILWLILPTFLIIITKRPIYDNFRQVLFLIPPIFLLCGYALDTLFHHVQKWGYKLCILLLIVVPGIYNGLNLHPYEYIYYNSFVGGVDGAFRKLESDYWMTSFREAAEYINLVAPQNARIVVWGIGAHLVKPYLRSDIITENEVGNTYSLVGGYDYVIASSRRGNDDIYPTELPIFVVKRSNTILSVVKRLTQFSSP